MPATAVTVAAVQMVSEPNLANNLNKAAELLAEASALGAECAVLPENLPYLVRRVRPHRGCEKARGRGNTGVFSRTGQAFESVVNRWDYSAGMQPAGFVGPGA